MKSLLQNKFGLLLIVGVLAFFCAPIWLQGKIPTPVDDLVGLYHPYRDLFADKYPNGIPYKNFLITDPIRQQYIWKKFAINELKNGKIPWWNPYTHSGMPMLANMQAGVFYPLNIIFWVLPFADAWTVFILLQSMLGGIFMYAYLRQQKLHPLASALGTICFIFSGFFISWWEWGNIGHTILWLPLLLLTIDKLAEKTTLKWHVIFLFALISQFFAGHLQTSFYVLVITTLYLLWKLYSTKQLKKLPLFLIPYSLFVIITAIQWLPTLELIKLSARDIDQTQILTRPDWFIPWQHLAQLAAPDFFGNPATLNYWGVWNYAEFVSYIGIIPLIFALSTVKNKTSKFWWLITITGLLFSLPTPLAKLPFILKIPFLSQAQPSRLLSIITFALAVLSAYGLHNFINNKSKKPLLISAGIIGTILAILWISTVKHVPLEYISVSRRNLIAPTVIWGISIILLLTSLRLKKALFLIPYSLFVLIAASDQLRFATKFTPFSPREYIFPETATIKFLKSDPDIFRIMSLDRRILPPNVAMYYGLQTIEGYDPLYLKSYAQVITEMETGHKQDQPVSFNRIISPTNLDSNTINKLNVKYVLSLNEVNNPNLKLVFQEGETQVYQNFAAMPRARMTRSDLVNKVEITEYLPSGITINISSRTENTLELADMMYPGWKAWVDYQEKEMTTSSENFRLISVPEGNHTITFQYSPQL